MPHMRAILGRIAKNTTRASLFIKEYTWLSLKILPTAPFWEIKSVMAAYKRRKEISL